MKKPKKQRTLIQQVIVTGVIFLVLAGGQVFLWGGVRSSANALHNKQTEAEQLEQLQVRVKAIQAKYEGDEPLVEQLSVPFPKVANTPQVVDRLEQVASKTGVIMSLTNITSQDVTAAAAKTSGQLTTVTVTLKLDGTAHALLEYIAALEHIQEVTTIQQWSFQPVTAITTPGLPKTGPQLYTITANVLFYLQP